MFVHNVFNIAAIAKQILEYIPVDPNFIIFKNVNRLCKSIVENTLYIASSENINNKISLTHLDLTQFIYHMAAIIYPIISEPIYTNNKNRYLNNGLKIIDELEEFSKDFKSKLVDNFNDNPESAFVMGLILLVKNRKTLKSVVVPVKHGSDLHYIISRMCSNILVLSIITDQSPRLPFLTIDSVKSSQIRKVNIVKHDRIFRPWSFSIDDMNNYIGATSLYDISIINIGINSKLRRSHFDQVFHSTDPLYPNHICALESYLKNEKELKLDPLINFSQICRTFFRHDSHKKHDLDTQFWKYMIQSFKLSTFFNCVSGCLSVRDMDQLLGMVFLQEQSKLDLKMIIMELQNTNDNDTIRLVFAFLLDIGTTIYDLSVSYTAVTLGNDRKLRKIAASFGIPLATKLDSKVFP